MLHGRRRREIRRPDPGVVAPHTVPPKRTALEGDPNVKRQLAIFGAAALLVALALPSVVAAADTQVVVGRVIGAHGTLMVASSNQLTLYTFDKDVKDSGISTCTGQCLVNWPALTVAAGDTPTGGAGVTGTLGTITRTDNGARQVTYNGLPLYFFINDKAPGDTNGIYTNWREIVLAAPTPTEVVTGRVIGTHGTLMVASSNQMTLYTFDKDVKDSGASTCTGQCLVNWPALTVAAGQTPTGGSGVTGTLGTITRTDNGALQVTYNGLPLYFFINDKAPGDTNGIYTDWREIVLAAAATPSPTAAPTAAPAPTEAPVVTPPPTSITPVGDGSGPGSPLAVLLLAGIGALGLLVAVRRLATTRMR